MNPDELKIPHLRDSYGDEDRLVLELITPDGRVIRNDVPSREAYQVAHESGNCLPMCGHCYREDLARLAAAELENLRLRAIFPKIFEAMAGQGGNCSADCSVEFLELIPAEVAAVFRKRSAGPPPCYPPELIEAARAAVSGGDNNHHWQVLAAAKPDDLRMVRFIDRILDNQNPAPPASPTKPNHE